MGKIYIAKFFLIAFYLMAGINLLHAQTLEYLDANNIKAGIATGGNLFSNNPLGNTGLFENPRGSGKGLIYTQALWISAKDSVGNTHLAAQKYFDYGVDYFDGPIVTTYDSLYDIYYKRVFKVDLTNIEIFRNMSFPANPSSVDPSILYWPGKGNPSVLSHFGVNIATPLAPFVDLNNNGIYEPLLGEYPGICGDEAIFFVFNDARAAHTQTNGTKLGVEIRGMVNGFSNTTDPLPYTKKVVNNAVFVQYEIENKSQNNYTDFNLGNWVDPDVGCFNNDYVGCDTARNLMFAYNGDANDPDCAPESGYGVLPIALGTKLLNDSLSVFGYFASGAVPATSDPISKDAYANYLHGQWADGTNFEYGGTGYNTNGRVTTYTFPGDPTDSTGWSEVTAITPPGDRRMYGATHANTFYKGEVKHYDWAFFSSYDSTSNHISIVDTLKRDADILLNYYHTYILPCQAQFVTAINEVTPELLASIYPNPANTQITITASDNIKSLQVIDLQGRLLLTETVGAKSTTLLVSNLAKGVYFVNIQCTGGDVVKRIVVE